MINESVRNKIIDKYGVDVIRDALLADDYHIVFCFDFNQKEKAEINILSGNLESLGIAETDELYVSDILHILDYDNPVADVIGKEFYLEYLFDKMSRTNGVTEMHFPIRIQGQMLWVVCTCQIVKVADDYKLIFGRVNWVTSSTPDAIKFYETTYRDELTKMYTRQALIYHLEQARNTDHSYGLYFDIDNFKRINDIFGHRTGDVYLTQLGRKFIHKHEPDVFYYRIGGDEFFIYMVNSTEEQAYRKAMQIIYDVEKLNPEGEQAEVSASIGIVPIIGSDFDMDDLLDLADRTMYHAKGKGKGNISYARDV